MKFNRPFPDHNQNFWELASIQSASMGMSGIILGWQLANDYGVDNAIGSICIGNLLTWLFGLIIVSMTYQDRTDAMQNVRKYLGKGSWILAVFSLTLAFLVWCIFQLKASNISIDSILKIDNNGTTSFRFGASLGLFAALMAIGGIRIIKWLNVICLPILIIYHVYGMAMSDNIVTSKGTWGLSIAAVSTVILFQLPGTINLPTFFRHSRSKAHSYLALTFMALFFTFFQISSIWISFESSSVPLLKFFHGFDGLPIILLMIFIVLLTTCNTVVNIYFASAGWEAISKHFEGPKEYAIIGMIGTAAYIFIQISPPMQFLVDLANYFLSCLGIVLAITFLIQHVIKRKPSIFGKLVGSSSWFAGCISALILEIQNPMQQTHILLFSMGISALFYLCAIFIEETIWSIKKLLIDKNIK